MGYPTPKQQKLIEAIEGMWLSQDEELAPKYDEYCREKGLDRSTYRAVRSYLDRYKEDFLEEQKRRRRRLLRARASGRIMSGDSAEFDLDYDEDLAFMEPEY